MPVALSTIRPLSEGEHVVQFYDDHIELTDACFVRLAVAATSGDACVVIATPEHLAACREAFRDARVDLDRALAERRVTLLDAHDVLRALLVDGCIDPRAFDRAVGDLIRSTAAERKVHAYGEIVALLWAEGNVSGAIEVEELWERLAADVDFSLHCGYPARLMADPGLAEAFAAVCGLHSEVIQDAPVPPGSEVSRRFVKDVRAPGSARRFVGETVRRWGHADLAEACELVAGELAANATIHAASSFTVSLSRRGVGVRIVVGDTSAHAPHPRTADRESSDGRGLHMIDVVAARWGCELVDGGKLVWADIEPSSTAR